MHESLFLGKVKQRKFASTYTNVNLTMSGFPVDMVCLNPSNTVEVSILPKETGGETNRDKNLNTVGKSCSFHYFHLHIKMWYYCGVIPFKLILNPLTGEYHIQKLHKAQRVKTLKFCLRFSLKSIYPNFFFQIQIMFTLFQSMASLYATSILRHAWK